MYVKLIFSKFSSEMSVRRSKEGKLIEFNFNIMMKNVIFFCCFFLVFLLIRNWILFLNWVNLFSELCYYNFFCGFIFNVYEVIYKAICYFNIFRGKFYGFECTRSLISFERAHKYVVLLIIDLKYTQPMDFLWEIFEVKRM